MKGALALYYNGQGVSQDYVLAYMWFNLSTYRYPASEQEKREAVIKAINIAASKMTAARIATCRVGEGVEAEEGTMKDWKWRGLLGRYIFRLQETE